MRSIHLILSILLLVLLLQCSSQERILSEIASDLQASGSEYVQREPKGDGSPLFFHALEFDRLMRNGAASTEVKANLEKCHTESTNPFCPSYKAWSRIVAVRNEKNKTRSPIEIRPILPVTPRFSGKEISNWKEVRTAPIQALLKGLLSVTQEEFKLLVKKSLGERRCPNMAAIAIAASLEDYLPDSSQISQIGDLYLAGARCTSKRSVDYEHYQTRAALFYIYNKEFSKAEQALSKVRAGDAFNGRSLYWLYRTRQELNLKDKAEQAYRQLIKQHPFSFHALVAQKSREHDPGEELLQERNVFSQRSKKNRGANKLLEQIEILKKYGFDFSAAILVDFLLTQPKVEFPVRLYAVQHGDPRSRVSLGILMQYTQPSALSKNTMELAFPKAFYPLFTRYASGSVSPWLAMSIARRESLFNPRAVSIANAQGIMQLNPNTALKLSGGKNLDLLDPQINIELGTQYLTDLIQRDFTYVYQGIAAYNAGETPVINWIKRYPTSDKMLFIDLIPYRETRDYVAQVLTNFFWYRRIYEGFISIKEVVP